jgi:hypothetical protein
MGGGSTGAIVLRLTVNRQQSTVNHQLLPIPQLIYE